MTVPVAGEGPDAHRLLLLMAGRVSDQALAKARRLLAGGEPESAIGLLADRLGQSPVPLTAAELAAVRTLSGDPAALPGTEPVSAVPALPFVFSGYEETGQTGRDELDDTLVAVSEVSSGVAAIWRTWRYIQLESPEIWRVVTTEETAHRVYLIQVTDPALIADVSADILAAVPESTTAGFEVLPLDEEPPPYQRAALSQSLLLWAMAGEPEFQLARVFDFADPVTGPGFAPDHLMIDDPVRIERLSAYLNGGYPALTTATTMTDVIDPDAGPVVPASFRTDGRWIWTDSVTYYLDRYGIAPDADLTEHIESQLADGVTGPW